MTYEYHYQKTDLQIYEAVFYDKWDSVDETFKNHPELRTKPINRRLETPLMIAVGTNQSHDFVTKLVSSLVHNGCINCALFAKNDEGDTALHYAAKVGNITDAKLLVSRSSEPQEIALVKNEKGSTPLLYAAWLGRKKEMLDFLFSKTGVLSRSTLENPATSETINQSFFGGDLLTPAIDFGFLDIALKLVNTYSNSVIRQTWSAQRPLHVLARKPKLFLSGRDLGFWGRLIYSCSPIKKIYDMKTRHRQAKKLVKLICKTVIEKPDEDVVWTILGSTMATAVTFGNYEVIEELISTYPSIIWANIEGSYLFQEAIEQRQVQVYNLVYQMTRYKAFVASHTNERKENALHIVARSAPAHRLNKIAGAALQMQRELQWFKEIETFVGPSQKEAYNIDNQTPRMVFSDAHKDLLKEGQQWIKDTAGSSTLVATLIVTVAFTAVFTLPGGDKYEGKIAFMLFIISDAIALFSSSTSVLMFLGILTSRYKEGDFLYVLPRRLTIGLMFLFLSLTATMISFSATLALVLQDKVKWIAAPLIIATCVPVVLFVHLHYPLLKKLIYSTYGPSIFHRQNKKIIH